MKSYLHKIKLAKKKKLKKKIKHGKSIRTQKK